MPNIIYTQDNGIEVIQNFTWDITKRKLCIFMPNYHGKKYTLFSIKQIKTIIPKSDYVIIIGDDNTNDRFDDIKEENVFYFSLQRREKYMRNGCFIRNFLIKRCQSELLFQKDGEVVVLGDFVKNCIESATPWRAGNIYVLDEKTTNDYLNNEDPNIFLGRPTKKIEVRFPDSPEKAKSEIVHANGRVNLSSYFHYAYCIKTDILKSINGYDEDYTHYGYEDSDMFCRLYNLGHRIIPDYSCSAIHLNHPRNVDLGEVKNMGDLFLEKDFTDSIRNPNKWGDGI